MTVAYLAVTYFILVSNCDSLKVDRDDCRNILASLVVACMYAASVGATLLVILGAIWEKFIKLKFSEGIYNAYDKTMLLRRMSFGRSPRRNSSWWSPSVPTATSTK